MPSKINNIPEDFAAAKAGLDDIGENIRDGFSSKAQVVSDGEKNFAGFATSSKNSNLNNIASQARKTLLDNANKNGQTINPNGVSGVGAEGLESINSTAAKNAFLKNLEDTTNENPYSSTRDNIEDAKDRTISQIGTAIANDPAYLASMPDFTQQAKDKTDEFIAANPDKVNERDDIQNRNLKEAQSQWIQAKAENEFANKVLGIGDVNKFDKDSNGIESLVKLSGQYKNDGLSTGVSYSENSKPSLEDKNRRRMTNAITKMAAQNQSAYDSIVNSANSEGQQVVSNYTMSKRFENELAKNSDGLTNYNPAPPTSSSVGGSYSSGGSVSNSSDGISSVETSSYTNSSIPTSTTSIGSSYSSGVNSVETTSHTNSSVPTSTTSVGGGYSSSVSNSSNEMRSGTTSHSNSSVPTSSSSSVGSGVNSVGATNSSVAPTQTSTRSASTPTSNTSYKSKNTNGATSISQNTEKVTRGNSSNFNTSAPTSTTLNKGSNGKRVEINRTEFTNKPQKK